MTTATDASEISIAQMDEMLKDFREAKEKYSAAKALSDAAHADMKEIEAAIIRTLEAAGKTTYIAEGFGRATLVEDLSVPTPKTPEEKRAFFAWLEKNKGTEVKDAYMTINSQSLQSLYKELTQEAALRGEILMVDGLAEPVTYKKLSFRKA